MRRVMTGGTIVAAVLAIGAWSGVPAGVAGQDLATVLRSAESTHPTLAGAAAGLEAAEAGVGEARSSRLPSVGVLATAVRYQDPMVVTPIHGFTPGQIPAFDETLIQGHASADWLLYDGGARSARIEAAESAAGAAASAVEASRMEVVLEATSAYLAALSAREVAAAHRERVAALERERDRSSRLLEEGKAARVMVLRTEAALSAARADLEAADESLHLALRRLARVSGLAPGSVTADGLVGLSPAAGGPLRADARDALVAGALESNPAVAAARRRAESASARVSAARSAWLPRLSLSARYSAFGSSELDFTPEWNGGVQISYPVWSGGARSRAVERAAAEATMARAELASTERRVADAVDAALSAWRSALARAVALEAAVAQSAEVARIEALALETGAGTQTDYLATEAELLRVRASLAQARHAVIEARARLAYATGDLTTETVLAMTEEL